MNKQDFIFTDTPEVERKARLALVGPTGSGKTYTGLEMLMPFLQPGKMIAVIDTERESAYLYKKDFPIKWLSLKEHHPKNFIRAIEVAENDDRFGAIMIDSLSHAWIGKDGTLELVRQTEKSQRGGNSFTAWGSVGTPIQNELVNRILDCKKHLLITMRSKMEYILEEYTDSNGKTKSRPKKVGFQPVQRDAVEYEFDLVGDLETTSNELTIGKCRYGELSGKSFTKDGKTPGKMIKAFLDDLAKASPAAVPPPPEPMVPLPSPDSGPQLTKDHSQLDEHVFATAAYQIKEATSLEYLKEVKDELKLSLKHRADLIAKFYPLFIERYKALSPTAASPSPSGSLQEAG